MKKLYVEIADTPIKRECGLMDRKKLRQNEGMLFKFPYANHLAFWMKNTYIPLDIAFINSSGKIKEIKEMVPLSTRAVRASEECKYALEVNKGWFKNNNINVGSYIGGIFDGVNIGNKMGQGMGGLMVSPDQQAMDPFADPSQQIPQEPQAPQAPQAPSPEVILNKTFKQILEDANLRGKELIIIYQTKSGVTLPPKSISPPFNFESNAEGQLNEVVKAWDNQTAGYKSFLIDNIIDLSEKEEKEEENKKV